MIAALLAATIDGTSALSTGIGAALASPILVLSYRRFVHDSNDRLVSQGAHIVRLELEIDRLRVEVRACEDAKHDQGLAMRSLRDEVATLRRVISQMPPRGLGAIDPSDASWEHVRGEGGL